MIKVYIIAKKMNAGKTSEIIRIFNSINKGDGFVSIKQMVENKVYGYEILQLSTNHKMQLILNEKFTPNNWEEAFKIGPYSFSKRAIKHVEESIEQMIEDKVTPIFLDEIGNLELQDKGFSDILKKLVKSESNIYITVREDLVDKVINKFMRREKICMI